MKKVSAVIVLMFCFVSVFAQEADPVKVGGVDLATIISVVLGAAAMFFSVIWGQVKQKLGEALSLLKLVVDSVEDNKLTNEEMNAIIAAAKKLINKA